MTGTVTISLEDYESLKSNSQNWLSIRELEIESGDERRIRAEARVAELELAAKASGELWNDTMVQIRDTLNKNGYDVTFPEDVLPIIVDLILYKEDRQDEKNESRQEMKP